MDYDFKSIEKKWQAYWASEKTFKAVAYAFREGVFINPVIPPACAPQDTLVRYALMATHTHEQVDESVEKLKKVFRELEIL